MPFLESLMVLFTYKETKKEYSVLGQDADPMSSY